MTEDINTLKTQLAAARVQLASTYDEKTFDASTKLVADLSKAIAIAENKARKEAADLSAADRAKAIAEHQAGLDKLKALKKQLATDDEALFFELGVMHADFEKAYEDHLAATNLAEDLRLEARNLGQPEPPSFPLGSAGYRSTTCGEKTPCRRSSTSTTWLSGKSRTPRRTGSQASRTSLDLIGSPRARSVLPRPDAPKPLEPAPVEPAAEQQPAPAKKTASKVVAH